MTQATPMNAVPLGNAFSKADLAHDQTVWVAIYRRVSTESQADDGFGLDDQLKIDQNYCARFANWRVFDIYTDGGVSGTATEREDLDRLLRDAEQNPIRFVIVARLDRQSREEYVGYYLDHQLAERGVTLVSATQDSNPYEISKMMRGFQRVIDAEDRRKIIANTNGGRQRAAENGYWVGGRLPFGYESTGGKRSVVKINENEAKIIRRVTELMVDEGLNLTDTVRALNAEGLLTRTGVPWTVSNLRSRVTSDAFAGVTVFRKIRGTNARRGTKTAPDGRPLLGETVQRQLPQILTPERHTALIAAIEANGIAERQSYLLSGFLHGYCGARLHGNVVQDVRRYKCSESCGERAFNAQVVEDAVWAKLASFLKDKKTLAQLAQQWIDELPNDRQRHAEHKVALTAEVERHRKTLESITLTLHDPNMDPDERDIHEASKGAAMLLYKGKKAALEQVTQILADYEEAQAEVTRMAALVKDASLRVDNMNITQKRTLLKLLKVHIKVTEQSRGDSGLPSPLEEWHRANGFLVPSDPADGTWETIEDVLRAKTQFLRFKATRDGLRPALCAILHRLRTGCRWTDVPDELTRPYGGYEACRRLQFLLWKKGLWPEIIEILGEHGLPIATPSPYPKLTMTGRFNPTVLKHSEMYLTGAGERAWSESLMLAKIMQFELEVV